jgi:hypothetical protein
MAEPMDPHASNDRGLAAFIDAEKREGHIVDIMIEERCPTWVGHWSWPVVKPGAVFVAGLSEGAALGR